MATDLDIFASVFTKTAILLQYKEGISKQWIEKVVENTGFNAWFRGRIADQLTKGSNPTPSTVGANVGGGSCLIWAEFTDATIQTIDQSMDWQDRWLTFIGFCSTDTVLNLSWGGSGMSNFNGDFYTDDNAANDPVLGQAGASMQALAARYCGAGSATLATGQNLGVRMRDSAGIINNYTIGPSSNGDLLVQSNDASVANTKYLGGVVFYSAQTGYRDDNP